MLTFDPSKKIHEQITEETWCKGVPRRGVGGFPVEELVDAMALCSGQWIAVTYPDGYGWGKGPQEQKFITYIASTGFINENGGIGIGDWQDRPERTFAEVLAAFKAADL